MATKRGAGTGTARKRAATKTKRSGGTSAAAKRAGTKRATGKRELLEPRAGDKRYVRRAAGGEFTESQDDVGRSLARDVKQRARTKVAAGRGDEGDQQRSRRKAAAKKSSARKSSARKSSAKRPTARKATARKTTARKTTARKTAGRR